MPFGSGSSDDDQHRRPIPIRDPPPNVGSDEVPFAGTSDDVDMAPQAATMSLASTGGAVRARGMHGETPITNIPRAVFNPWPKTINVIMPYRTMMSIGVTNDPATTPTGYSFRLNSIYDCRKNTYTYTADPSATADTADGTVNTPHMRPYWMTFYRYWSVVRSRYRVTIMRLSTAIGDRHDTFYFYHHGLQGPPLVSTGTTPVEHRYRKHHPGVKWLDFYSRNMNTAYTNNSIYDNTKYVHGYYEPGSIRHEIVEDELAQTWHKDTEVPPTPEMLTIIPQVGERDIANTVSISYRMWVEIEYEVQLKDLYAQYEYLTANTNVPAITTFAQAN